MTEAEFQHDAEVECTRLRLLYHHCPKSYLCRGPRGYPDLVALGPWGLAVAELKAGGGRASAEQNRWAWAWRAAGIPYVVASTLAEVTEHLEAIA